MFTMIALSNGLNYIEFLSLIKSTPNRIIRFDEDYLLYSYYESMKLAESFYKMAIGYSVINSAIGGLRKEGKLE